MRRVVLCFAQLITAAVAGAQTPVIGPNMTDDGVTLSIARNVAIGIPLPATDPPAGSLNVAGKIYKNGVEFTGGGGGGNCKGYSIAYSRLTAAATTQELALGTFSGWTKFTGITIKEAAQMGGGSVATLTVSIGRAAADGGAGTEVVAAKPLMQTPSTTQYFDDGGLLSPIMPAADATNYNVVLKFTSTGANLGNGSASNLTAGSVNVWYCSQTLPAVVALP